MAQMALSDGLLERLTGTEARHATLRNVDRCAGLRIPGLAGLPVRGLECAEADERDGVAFLQGFGDRLNQRIDCACGGRLRETGLLRKLGHEFTLVHAPSWSV